jgi:predicted transcriptional regulator
VATRDADIARIAKLDRRGYSQSEIARVVGVSQQQISEDLKVIRKRYREEAMAEYKERVEEKRAQLREVRAEAWRAWERSKKDARKVVEEERTLSDGTEGSEKKTTTTEGQLPDATYLRVVIETLRDECSLDGLNAPQKVNANVNVIDWGELFKRTMDSEVDQVEQRLAEIEAEVLAGPVLPTPTPPGPPPTGSGS